MLSFFKWILPATVAVGLLVGLSAKSAMAADNSAKGTVTGKVVDQDGKAVADAKVNLYKARERGQGQQAQQGQQRQRPEALATATTDKDGKFTLKLDSEKVADGQYTISTMVRGKGAGRATVKVAEGKATPGEVTLKLAQGQGRGRTGGARNGGGAAQ